MTARVDGVHQVVYALRQHGEDVEREVSAELNKLANYAATRMRSLASKGATSALTNSIKAEQIDPMTWTVGTGLNYARFVEDGVKPGGKGLPKYMGPTGRQSAAEWLKAMPDRSGAVHNRTHLHARRKGSKVFDAAARALQNRYYGLADYLRKSGSKPHPFFEPTLREIEPEFLRRMEAAVQRALARRPEAGGTTA